MTPVRSSKPLVSAALALLLVLAFVLPFLQIDALGLKNPNTPWDDAHAGAIHYGIIIAVAAIWLGVQLFWKTTTTATKLGLAASATIFWLAIALMFGFRSDSIDEGVRGAVAFFTLMGGLGVTLVWTHFLADDISF